MDRLKTFPQKKLPSKEQRHKLFGSVEPAPGTKPVDKQNMADLQNTREDFLFDLDAVGIKNVKHPITVESALAPHEQTTIGVFTLTSGLKQTNKGTNMSRFTEVLAAYSHDGFRVDVKSLKHFTKALADRLEQNDASVEISFPWFFRQSSPHSGLTGMNHADVSIKVSYDRIRGYRLSGEISALIATLCPCSKEISEYSAHNQRGQITMEIDFDQTFDDTKTDWKKILLEAAESNASAKLYPVLKRPDEKIVTETAYENPRFVEDITRLVAADLYELSFVKKFKVSCLNEESIHMHDAVASITYDKETNDA
ncbi:GTP cyclohydrolase FolE2 [Virgibacillus kimchii]